MSYWSTYKVQAVISIKKGIADKMIIVYTAPSPNVWYQTDNVNEWPHTKIVRLMLAYSYTLRYLQETTDTHRAT